MLSPQLTPGHNRNSLSRSKKLKHKFLSISKGLQISSIIPQQIKEKRSFDVLKAHYIPRKLPVQTSSLKFQEDSAGPVIFPILKNSLRGIHKVHFSKMRYHDQLSPLYRKELSQWAPPPLPSHMKTTGRSMKHTRSISPESTYNEVLRDLLSATRSSKLKLLLEELI